MQLADKSGINCDLCGTEYKIDFVYYSFDFRNVNVYNNARPSIESILRSTVIYSADVCTNCFDDIKKQVINNYSKTMSSTRATRQFITCDITGTKLIGTYEYYYCVVSKIDIKISGQLSICAKCQTKIIDNKKPCPKCSSTAFVKIAKTNIDNRFVDITMCSNAYKDMITKIDHIKSIANKWSTTS